MDKRKLANQQVKDRLLAALIDFAGRKDWSKVTVTELVEQAGVARASFYRNFSSVEDLVDYGIRQVTQRYHEGMPTTDGNPRSREHIEYQFRFYQEHASLVLGFHRAKASTSLLDLVTDCEIASHGDMSASSPERYQLYFYAGAFYNVLICWLESGMKESPAAMADEFARMLHGTRERSELFRLPLWTSTDIDGVVGSRGVAHHDEDVVVLVPSSRPVVAVVAVHARKPDHFQQIAQLLGFRAVFLMVVRHARRRYVEVGRVVHRHVLEPRGAHLLGHLGGCALDAATVQHEHRHLVLADAHRFRAIGRSRLGRGSLMGRNALLCMRGCGFRRSGRTGRARAEQHPRRKARECTSKKNVTNACHNSTFLQRKSRRPSDVFPVYTLTKKATPRNRRTTVTCRPEISLSQASIQLNKLS